ncbi:MULTISPECIES: class I adenylate-forming enzyme family protein [unclassified Variovorax]|uniref:class I adenylate-forming enzyme family protein n=1 Tax=unclassified Variovorax TaxID=663243 RepID=UPI001BD4C4E6|nr:MULTISPECIES: AMP-binding protein [unclassified Variovorax]
MGVISLFDYGAARHADRPCLEDDLEVRTYEEVRDASHRIALALGARGVVPGDKISTLSPNAVTMVEAMLGIYRAGCVFVPLNVLNSEEENSTIIQNNDVSVLFYHSKFSGVVERLLKVCPRIRLSIRLDAGERSDQRLREIAAAYTGEAPDPGASFHDLASIYSTGGTTGAPKGAMISGLAWDVQAASFFAAMPVRAQPVYLAATPMTHAAGCLAIYLFAAGGHVIMHDRFEAGRFLATIDERRATHVHLPPTAIYMLLSHPDAAKHDYSSLECFHYASAPMSVEKLKQCMEIFGPVMAQTWGQSEAPLICTLLTPDDHRLAVESPDHVSLLASCGRPTLMTRVEVIDDSGRFLSVGEMGELVMNGPLVGLGYYRKPDATASTFVNGWLRSGDIGYKDARGYVFICDRKKEMIISGGLNIYPAEVEQVVWSHPAVQECAVIGVPDEKWGEAVKAVIELKPGMSASQEDLLALCKSRLGSAKAPKSIEIWPSLPRSAVGKVSKKEIRARFWDGTGRSI